MMNPRESKIPLSKGLTRTDSLALAMKIVYLNLHKFCICDDLSGGGGKYSFIASILGADVSAKLMCDADLCLRFACGDCYHLGLA